MLKCFFIFMNCSSASIFPPHAARLYIVNISCALTQYMVGLKCLFSGMIELMKLIHR
jgi:hypothetical protein